MAGKKRLSGWANLKHKLAKYFKSHRFSHLYLIISCVILGLTALIWSSLSAVTHLGNADQLVNTYLLESPDTFSQATFPDQHSFLLKLPFFFLIHVLGNTAAAYTFVTILVVMLTVGLFAYLLSRIERRPVVLGTLFLALSLSLLLIPTEPYAGSLLPLNMGMVTTRNVEYIIFIAGLYFITRTSGFKSRAAVAATLLFAILFASDKLFVPLALGGAGLLLIVSLLLKRRDLVRVAFFWLTITIISLALAIGALLLLNSTHLFHTTSVVGTGPFAVIQSLKDLLIGSFYGVTGIFTNFGANPISDARVIKDIPHELIAHATAPVMLSFVVTVALALLILWSMCKIVVMSLRPQLKGKQATLEKGFLLGLMLFWVSITAVAAFILSNHYYPADGRYEAIIFFAGFVCLAQYLRHIRLRRKFVAKISLILLGGILLAVPFVIGSFMANQKSDSDLKDRNNLIAKNLAIHSVDTLVGDYWRVFPIKLATANIQNVLPMANCTAPRDILSSRNWQTNLANHSFAYIVTLDKSVTDYPPCSLNDILKTYGKPNQTAVIKGTVTEPKELLLFYDKGIVPPVKNPTPEQESSQLNTIRPITLDQLPKPVCPKKTILSFVAHEDDDILFMNPDLLHDLDAGNCIRSVYLTAGDSGNNELYWLKRQKGAEAAYDTMLGIPDQLWNERTLILPEGQFATVANPKGNKSISLIFLHLPDGNLSGEGFASTGRQSLQKLKQARIGSITTVDHNSTYSSTQLTNGLISLIDLYKPAMIRSQSSYNKGRYADHSDHISVSYFATEAYETYQQATQLDISMTYYLGYPVHGMPRNVSGNDLDRKAAAFLSFAKFDSAVCQSMVECDTKAVYGIYLRRQYTN
jgi:LmbE family N-acetylglucosaminyl deacetylase